MLDVLDNKAPAENFTNKIVLLGNTALGNGQWTRTPFDKDSPKHGIYVHAAALHTLLEGNWLRMVNRHVVAILLLVAGPSVSLTIRGLPTLRKVSIWIAGTGSWLVICYVAIHQNYALPVVTPLATFGLVVAAQAIIENFDKRVDQEVSNQLSLLLEQYIDTEELITEQDSKEQGLNYIRI